MRVVVSGLTCIRACIVLGSGARDSSLAGGEAPAETLREHVHVGKAARLYDVEIEIAV
jgi:hypothetical protein